ncbi:MAG: FG-GAP repeat domain-containing protein [Thermoguttaceae bacterium]
MLRLISLYFPAQFAVILFFTAAFQQTSLTIGAEPVLFKVHRIDHARFEAAGVGDFNRDGRPDIVAGEYLYLAPDWKKVKIRQIPSDVDEKGKGYAHDFANLVMDVDGDGFPDIIACDWFSEKSNWFRNPGKDLETSGLWDEHLLEKNGNFETLDFWDVTGSGEPLEIVPSVTRTVWYEKTDKGQFTVHIVSEKQLPFGQGVGDLNGDGRPDILRPTAWFEAPSDIRKGTWIEHSLDLFGEEPNMSIKDAAQILVLDVNEDGLADIIVSAAHDYGIFWFEQLKDAENGELAFKRHLIDKSFSQVHALALADVDGDGQKELIAGKRYMAHNGHDPGEYEPLGVYWFKSHKEKGQVIWEKHNITFDEGIGAGMSIVPVDMNGNGRIDFVTTGKFGGPVWLENLGESGK